MSSWNIKSHVRPRKWNVPSPSVTPTHAPTFHVLIATAGRPCLKRMLDSLKNELIHGDAITIVFDGEGAMLQSGFSNTWIDGHHATIQTIEQKPNLGYWGHGIRNKYQGILHPITTFVMHADDDDVYVRGCFEKLRKLCVDPNILYIAPMLIRSTNAIVPSQQLKITKDDIGTPCGIIPFHDANKSTWEPRYGGDFSYYSILENHVKQLKYISDVIYIVQP
jgi:hypothetical protein